MTPLLLLLSLTLVLLSFSTTPASLTQAFCIPGQRHALIQLKQGFKADLLQSWNASTDCCTWDGITCDQLTGMVIELDLSSRSISGELNPALFNITSLQYLDLSNNWFHDVKLPDTGFERLTNLTHLDLSCAGFVGDVPISISVLTNLISLDLSNLISSNGADNNLLLDGSRLQIILKNLTKLQVLYLDGVNISSNGSEWGNAVSQVGHTLEELSMMDCSLTGPIDPTLVQLKLLKVLQLDSNNLSSHMPIFLANFSSLRVLSLSACGLRGPFSNEIFHKTDLTVIELSENHMLSGQLPEFTNGSLLQHLFIGGTNFTGPIPNSIGYLQKLSTLELSFCDFYGEVPTSVVNLTKLIDVYFQRNRFTGMIPISLFSHPSLESLDLSENKFTGYLSEFSNWSSALRHINFGTNNLQGKLPISVFKVPLLSKLNLASNNFTGTVNLDIIKLSKNLIDLDLSNNKLSIAQNEYRNKSFYALFPQLNTLNLASCSLTKFPSFLIYQTDIIDIDLSSNKIDGAIPNWLWNNKALSSLNLSHNFFTEMQWDSSFISHELLGILDIHSNMITGSVPVIPPTIWILDFSSNYFFLWPSHFAFYGLYLSLSDNRLQGEIPLTICNASYLEVLDLSYNNLTGKVPSCFLKGATFIRVINLKSNKLSGTFPRDITQGCGLTTIIFSRNRINGSLPSTLTNCNDLEVLDLGNNQIRDIFPYFLGNLKSLKVLSLRSNQFYGTISNIEMNHNKVNGSLFPVLKVLDLSSNSFNGRIPQSFFGILKGMVTNSNTDTPTIRYKYGYLSYYQSSVTITFRGLNMDIENSLGIFNSLDLSNNGFWGEIPVEIGQLVSLDVLNLSHNAFFGPIPFQFGNLKQLESLDLSFNQLSGHIPQELTFLTFLSALNLSYNNLVGEIPQARQFSTFSNSCYLGNPGLCGTPLSIQCGSPQSNHGLNDQFPSKSSTDIVGLSVSIGVGFGVGFASVIWALVSCENGRKWFNFNIDRFYFRHLYRRKFMRALSK